MLGLPVLTGVEGVDLISLLAIGQRVEAQRFPLELLSADFHPGQTLFEMCHQVAGVIHYSS